MHLGVKVIAKEDEMKAIVDLFSTDYGLMSIAVILCVLVMAGWYAHYFKRKVDEAVRAQERLQATQRRDR